MVKSLRATSYGSHYVTSHFTKTLYRYTVLCPSNIYHHQYPKQVATTSIPPQKLARQTYCHFWV